MVPVGVAQEDLYILLSAVDDGSTQGANAGAGIDDDGLTTGLYLHARGIATVAQLREGRYGK
jgi:hypothetical protein